MSGRTLVPIFFFWALLTIITPTLILLSENSKADHDVNGNVTVTEGMKARRMVGYAHNYILRTTPLPAKSVVAEGELASSSAPAPAPVLVMDHSHHNQTSNNTNYGLTLSSNNTHIQLNQKDSR
ncbi:hypothetical protein PIB30_002112 [Stylosanthes scabra]|uniref:Transmembrane protein n=1 Tax=Stylosanthes scabra TaxID=79078 RepID=A0ABU6R3D6_9FABA|nr:hypothetical protein [Stylosanthes scabra]